MRTIIAVYFFKESLTVKIEKKSFFAADGKNIFFPIFFKNILMVSFYRKSNTCNMEVIGVLFGKK